MDGESAEFHCSQPLSFGSLFAGIGGFDLGFERAGMVCKWQVEIDDYANRVLSKHWPNVRRWPDVRTWPQPDTERVDVICGGFPCQDISYAGQGAGLDGSRSGLFFEAIRVVCELRPKVVVLENVAALLVRGLDRVLGTLAENGYDAQWTCLSAKEFGAPHKRERVFVVAYPNEARLFVPGQPSSRTNRKPSYGESGLESEEHGSEWWRIEPGLGRVVDGLSDELDEDRRCKRIGSLGNAVVPQVAEWIGRRIVETAGRMPVSCVVNAPNTGAAKKDRR